MKIRKRCLLFFSTMCILSQQLSAQRSDTNNEGKFGLTADAGLSVPTTKNIHDVFSAGLNIAIGFKIPPLQKNRFQLKPTTGVKWYFKEIESTNSITEHFRTWKAGFELQYHLLENKNISLFPIARIDYNWSSNYYSKTYNYNPWTNTSSVQYSDKYLKGSGMSYDAGFKILFDEKWYLKVDYEFYKTLFHLDRKLIEAAEADGFLVNSDYKLNFSSINISAGIDLNL